MNASKSYLPSDCSRGVTMSPPAQTGTTVPFGRPVVVLGDGRGSYLAVSLSSVPSEDGAVLGQPPRSDRLPMPTWPQDPVSFPPGSGSTPPTVSVGVHAPAPRLSLFTMRESAAVPCLCAATCPSQRCRQYSLPGQIAVLPIGTITSIRPQSMDTPRLLGQHRALIFPRRMGVPELGNKD